MFLNIIKDSLNKHYQFRYNSVKRRIEYRNQGTEAHYEPVDRIMFNSILNEISSSVPMVNAVSLRQVLESNFSQVVDPIKEYFKSLPTWNGHDHIADLAATVRTDNQDLWLRVLRKFLMGVVKCATEENFENQHMLTLIGAQGLGKSTWLMRLVPESLREYVHSGTINPRSKDDQAKLSECLFINMDELDAMGKRNAPELKELITRKSFTQRRPYAAVSESMTRRASFVGSLNTFSFLHDQTGNRRILAFHAYSIELDVFIDIDQLYAQVCELLNAGESPIFDAEEVRLLHEQNESYVVRSPIEEAIRSLFLPGIAGEDEFLQANQIADAIKHRLNNVKIDRSMSTKVGRALGKQGFKRDRQGETYGYYVQRRDKSNVTAALRAV